MVGYLVVIRDVLSGKTKSALYDKDTGDIDDVISYAEFEMFGENIEPDYLEVNIYAVDLPRENENVREYQKTGNYNALIKVEHLTPLDW